MSLQTVLMAAVVQPFGWVIVVGSWRRQEALRTSRDAGEEVAVYKGYHWMIVSWAQPTRKSGLLVLDVVAGADECRDRRLTILGKLQRRLPPTAPLFSPWSRIQRAEASAGGASKAFLETSCGASLRLRRTAKLVLALTHLCLIPAELVVQLECKACLARIAWLILRRAPPVPDGPLAPSAYAGHHPTTSRWLPRCPRGKALRCGRLMPPHPRQWEPCFTLGCCRRRMRHHLRESPEKQEDGR
mmetsp:Transcript_21409/g.54722  ORF Transcript_21409/g.54722 Transcript_21409/m.54722 type:complete len:243 (+) Transcript_21409:681-1409(+)